MYIIGHTGLLDVTHMNFVPHPSAGESVASLYDVAVLTGLQQADLCPGTQQCGPGQEGIALAALGP